MLAFKLITIAFIAVFLIMTFIWWLQKKQGNAGIVDIAWSYNFPIIAILYYLLGDGYGPRKLLITAMVLVWGIRLGTYLLIRVLGHFKEEDGRYKQLREDWKDNLQFKFFMFFQFQAVINLALSIPFLILCLNTDDSIKPLEMVGAAIWCISILGESIADAQLKRFKAKPANKGKVCQNGLWNYSRHPNYFFEWMIWVGYFITALSPPYGWAAIVCPIMMLWFLYKVTGIPMTEEQSIRSKGQAYIDYQQTTSPFIPWFKTKMIK